MSLEDLVLSEVSWGREERNTRSRLCVVSAQADYMEVESRSSASKGGRQRKRGAVARGAQS